MLMQSANDATAVLQIPTRSVVKLEETGSIPVGYHHEAVQQCWDPPMPCLQMHIVQKFTGGQPTRFTPLGGQEPSRV